MKIISKEVQEALDKIDSNTDWIIDGGTKAKLEIVSLDYLLRWSRAKMLEKVLKEGKYKVEQFTYDKWQLL